MSRSLRIAYVATVDLTLRFVLLDQMQRLQREGFEVVGISAPGPWTGDLEAKGIRHISWHHVTRAWDPKADALAFKELLEILRSERFDLVHTHNPKPGVMGRIAGRLLGVPCVVNTVHGFYATPDDPPRRCVPVFTSEWIAARFSDLELFASEEDLITARRLGIVRRSQGRLLGNGRNLSVYDPEAVSPQRRRRLREDLLISDDALVVGAVGRLVAEKGFHELFEAARIVRAEVPNVVFLVVGGRDEKKADSISEAEIARVGPDVQITGWRDDVRDMMSVMDVFVLPSWREGLPLSAIEAAAMGKPLVLTNIRGCREIVRHGTEGFLVPPREPAVLAEAILRLVRDPELRQRMGSAARARAVARFDERRVEEILLGAYRHLLGRKGLLHPTPSSTRIRGVRASHVPSVRPRTG